MERGFEQLFIIAAVILAGVFDLLVRWRKSRQRKDAPADASRYDQNPVLVEEEADSGLPSDIELSGEELVERGVPPPLPPPARVPVVSRRPAPPPIRPRRVSRRLLVNPLDARRGIVMMTILGPCRGLERPDSEA
jgi:hypothetical protein